MALTYNKATRDLSIKGTITFNNGEQVHLTDSEILHYSIDQQLGNEGLPLGSAEAASFNLEISNVGRRFTPEQFDNAEVHMFVGIKTGSEYVYSDFGVWYVDSTSSPEQSVSVSLSGYDALATRFSAVFTDEKTLYPSTIGTLAQTVCLAAGIALKSTAFPNAAVKISKMPAWEDETTLRDILSYCAICAGGYVRIARNGMVEIVCFADGETHRLNPGLYQAYTPSGGTAFSFNCIEAMLTKDDDEYSRFAVDDKITSNATNTIQVEYNPLLTKAIVQSIVTELTGITMSAGDITWGGDPSVMCTDYYIVTSLDGSEHKLMVTSQSYSFDGGLTANESCSLPTINTQSSAAYSTSTNMYDANGNLKATRISGLDKKVITATVGHFEQLTADTIETDSLVTAYLSAIDLLAKSIKTTDIETNTLTSVAAEIIRATIRKITAGTITTDELYASFAEMFALKLNSLTAKDIETDNLAAAFASFTVMTAGNATFDRATITNLVAEAMSLEFGVADQVFIKNLAVEYAQMVGAAIGNLCIKASDGNYYLIDVNADGTVTATPATITDGEISAGQTEGGKVILDTSITAESLNTGNLLATYALLNRIDAARIDVDQLFAREAFINLLRTEKIVGDKSIEMIAETADNAQQIAKDSAIHDGFNPPSAPIPEGKLWLDRTTVPPVLKRWLGDADVPTDGSFTRELSGNPITTVGQALSFDSVACAFGPIQEGSGEPSPLNVRPIYARTRLEITRSSNSGASDTYAVEFPAIYGGRYNFTTGTLATGVTLVDLADCTLHSVGTASTGIAYARVTLPKSASGTEISACSHYQMVPAGTQYANGMARILQNNMFLYDARFTTADAAAQIIAAEKPQLVYEAGTVSQSQLTRATISALPGVNTLLADENCVLTIAYTGTGWETVNDTATLQNAQDILIAQQEALRREVNELNSFTKLDGDGLWVGKQGATGQTLLKYDSVNIVVNGKTVATFAGKYLELGGMRMFTPAAGGLAFAPSGN